MSSIQSSPSATFDFESRTDLVALTQKELNGRQALYRVLRIAENKASLCLLPDLHPSSVFELANEILEGTHESIPALGRETECSNLDELKFPLHTRSQHLCAGLNYLDHAHEMGSKAKLVVFPKWGIPNEQAFCISCAEIKDKRSPVPLLLDYEIELGLCFDRDIRSRNDLAEARAGFFVANDLTDRATQIYFHGDFPENESYSFSAAKSKRGFLLCSPILVIPKTWQSFYKNFNLELFVNGVKKQSSSTKYLAHSIEEILEAALLTPESQRWPKSLLVGEPPPDQSQSMALLATDQNSKPYLPMGTLILTGSPGGTIFQRPGIFALARAALSLLLSSRTQKQEPLLKRLKRSLIDHLGSSNTFLKAGDKIHSRIDCLGPLNFEIVS